MPLNRLKDQVFTKHGLSFLFVSLLWVPFASPWHRVPAIAGIYCSLIVIGLVWLLRVWKGWGDLADSRSEAGGWLPVLGYGVLLGMLLDLYRVPTPRGVGNLVVTIIVVFASILALHFESRIEFFFRGHRRLGQGLLLLGVILITLLLIGCNLRAKWGLIDDHEIMKFLYLGSNGQVQLADIPRLLIEQTEVGIIGVRFRPSYFALRLLETSLWGDRPEVWYAVRIAMYAVAALLFWLALYAWIGIVPATMVSIYCLSLGYWADIWCRLGPAETYCVVGTALFAYGGLRLTEVTKPSEAVDKSGTHWWGLVISGTVVASGSKENFLLLVPAAWFIGLVLWRQRRLNWGAAVALMVLTTWGAFLVVRILMGIGAAGMDVYGGSVSSSHRLHLLTKVTVSVLLSIGWQNWLVIAATVGCVAWMMDDRGRKNDFLKNVAQLFVCSLMLLLLYASQYAFYDGKWPCGNRYDFPGALAVPLFWVTFAFFSLKIFEAIGLHPGIRSTVRAGLLVGLCCLVSLTGFDSLVSKCCRNASLTNDFSRKFDLVTRELSADPERPLVLVCCKSPWCYEPVDSVRRFLTARGLQNPLFLMIEENVSQTPFERRLFASLERASLQGHRRRRFLPLSELGVSGEPFVLGLGCSPRVAWGTNLGFLTW